jgi:ribosomal protein S18 acetylase RimI-like enzyme
VSEPAALHRPDSARPRGGGPEEGSPPPSLDEQQAIERQLARLPQFAGAVIEHLEALDALVVRLPGRGPGYNFAACLRWTAESAPERLAALRHWFHDAGEWPALILADGLGQPSDLAGHLAAEGWVELERERIYATRRQPTVPHLSPTLRLESVTARTAAECQAIEQQVFGLAERHTQAREEHLARAVESGALRAYLLRLDGRTVASARLSVEGGLAAISGVGVLPEHRGMGLAGLVTSVATRAGLATGGALVWLSVDERNEAALKVYRRIGYEPSFGWSRWAVSAR